MSDKSKPSKPKTGNSKVQLRVQEFVKKLHPDVLRTQFRNFRKFVISTATTEKRGSKDETVARLPKECYNISSSKIISLHSAGRADSNQHSPGTRSATNAFVCAATNSTASDESYHGRVVTDDMDVNIIVPEVIIPKEGAVATVENCQAENSGVHNLQLSIQTDNQPRNKSPITVQEWVDSLPLTPADSARSHQLVNKSLHEKKKKMDECEVTEANLVPTVDTETDNLTLGAEAGHLCVNKPTGVPIPPVNVTITSCQEPSEVESHCSSVDSLLEARKPDPEEILLSLGFGGTASSSYLETGRIPKRFLKQSTMKGVDIEEFIKQQQDLIYTFESGYYGYRGLAGPSHSSPSVIVAKILEKLRDHEKETASMTSYQLDFRKGCSLEINPEPSNNKKFCKVARNVLTKIRCTPGSVLSPDNRRWLDSQGNKSPEIARRLILGQQSFTFGRDGDLIEASNMANEGKTKNDLESDEKRAAEPSESYVNVRLTDDCPKTEEGATEISSPEDGAYEEDLSVGNSFHRNNGDRRLTDSSTDMSVESMVIRTDTTSSEGGGRTQFVERTPSTSSEHSTREHVAVTAACSSPPLPPPTNDGNVSASSSRNSTLKRLNPVVINDDDDDDDSVDNINLSNDSKTESTDDVNESTLISSVDKDGNTNKLSSAATLQCHREPRDCAETATTSTDDEKEFPSLRDELKDSGVRLANLKLNNEFMVEQSSAKKYKNVLTRYSSFEESVKENSDDELSVVCSGGGGVSGDDGGRRSLNEYQSSEKTDQCSDSATESEFASYASRSLIKNIRRQYEDLTLLESKLQSLGRPLKVISEHQFSAISPEQRCALQSQIIREALEVYLNQLTEDEMHLELKNCLSTEAQKVADLLDSSSDTSKLSVIVRQMTLLLQHQSQLSAQIKELSIVDKKPSSCHEMCDHILKRVHELELLVQENAQELAQMKYQLLSKNSS